MRLRHFTAQYFIICWSNVPFMLRMDVRGRAFIRRWTIMSEKRVRMCLWIANIAESRRFASTLHYTSLCHVWGSVHVVRCGMSTTVTLSRGSVWIPLHFCCIRHVHGSHRWYSRFCLVYPWFVIVFSHGLQENGVCVHDESTPGGLWPHPDSVPNGTLLWLSFELCQTKLDDALWSIRTRSYPNHIIS